MWTGAAVVAVESVAGVAAMSSRVILRPVCLQMQRERRVQRPGERCRGEQPAADGAVEHPAPAPARRQLRRRGARRGHARTPRARAHERSDPGVNWLTCTRFSASDTRCAVNRASQRSLVHCAAPFGTFTADDTAGLDEGSQAPSSRAGSGMCSSTSVSTTALYRRPSSASVCALTRWTGAPVRFAA